MKLMKKILLLVTALFVSLAVMQAAPVTVTAKLDSTTLLMGKVTALHVQVVQPKGTVGFFPLDRQDTVSAMVEIAGRPAADTVDLGNNRMQVTRDIILQAFDSGMYVIPAVKYVVGKDTFQAKQLALKVMPVNVDSLTDVHDIKPVVEIPFSVLDMVPDVIARFWWAWLLALLLLAFAAFAYFKWYKKGVNPLKPERKRLPPYEEAMINLRNLKARQLWQQGQEKEYFTALTDILRVYIDRRFHVNAVEMTSTEIIATLRENEETRAVNEQLSMILEVADFVKFAGARPLADDNERAYQRAVDFVEATKPVSVEEPEAGKPEIEKEVQS